MSKAIRWQVPFVSLKGDEYRVDIYDEGWIGAVTPLVAGANPFMTDEASDSDFFAPVRGQSGTMSLIDMDGSTLRALVPENNLSRPVILRRKQGAVWVREWQGFISCETYAVSYQSTPQSIDLQLLSVIQAMDSMHVDQESLVGMKSIREILSTVFDMVNDEMPDMIAYVCWPNTDSDILNKILNTSILYDQNEVANEDSTTYMATGMSAKKILEMICTFMGWTAREQDNTIYLQRLMDKTAVKRATLAVFEAGTTVNNTAQNTIVMSELEYRGADHQRSTTQGAKSVAVEANTSGKSFTFNLPSVPAGDMKISDKALMTPETSTNEMNAYVAQLRQSDIYSIITMHYFVGTQKSGQNGSVNLGINKAVYAPSISGQYPSIDSVIGMDWWKNERVMDLGTTPVTPLTEAYARSVDVMAGAFYAKMNLYEPDAGSGEEVYHEYQDGVLLSTFNMPYNPNAGIAPIFTQQTVVQHTFTKGYFNLNTAMTVFYCMTRTEAQSDLTYKTYGYSCYTREPKKDLGGLRMYMVLKVGNKYWTGSSWTTSYSAFLGNFGDGNNFYKNWDETFLVKETDGMLIPVADSDNLTGVVEFSILSAAFGGANEAYSSAIDKMPYGMFMSRMDIDYIYTSDDIRNNRKANNYYRVLGTKFSDEISVQTDLATDMHNVPSPHIIRTSEEETASSILYWTNVIRGGSVQSVQLPKRPESDLMDRLEKFYMKARTTIELIVERPATALPVTRITGYDGKTYAPLSESRDWGMDTSTIRMIEEPE